MFSSTENTIQDVEDFLQRGLDHCPQDHDSAIGTPEVVPSNDLLDVHAGENPTAVQHGSSTAVAPTDITLADETLLNSALDEDTLDVVSAACRPGWILTPFLMFLRSYLRRSFS